MPDIYLDTDTFNQANADVWERGTNTAVANNWETDVNARAPTMAADAQERADAAAAADRQRQADQWAADAAAKAAAINPPAPAPAPPADVAPAAQPDTSTAPAPASSVPGVPAPAAPAAPAPAPAAAPVTPTSPVTAPLSDPTSTRQPLPIPQPVTETTAGMSGGGSAAGKITPQGQQILAGSADIASWLGGDGQKTLQAILVTEGGLSGARGDHGRSAGPLQFYEGGQLASFAQQHGMTLDQAKTYVEQNPLEAIRWAIGTQDAPGYLGSAILAGQKAGLSGATLATYAQQHGQVSVSPERAGQNYNALFGGGQDVVHGASGDHPYGPPPVDNGHGGTGQTFHTPTGDWKIAFGFNQPYGSAQFNSNIPNHRGVDLTIPDAKDNGRGTPYTAFQPGTVVALTHDPDGGNGIIVQTADGLYNRYFHNDKVLVNVGDKVDQNTQIGVLGASGTEGFPHLHFEVSRGINGDPMNQLIDPRPYMMGGSAQGTSSAQGSSPAPQAGHGSPDTSTAYDPSLPTAPPFDTSSRRSDPFDYLSRSVTEPLDPLKQLGDTISGAITTGLRSLFGGTTTPAPEGGGYGAVPAGGVDPLHLMPPSPLPPRTSAIVPEGGGYGAVPAGQPGAAAQQFGEAGRQAYDAITGLAQSPYLPTNLQASALRAVGQGITDLGQSPVGQFKAQYFPSILDPNHPFSVMADLEQKYGTSMPTDQMTPEDRKRANDAMLAIGGVEMPSVPSGTAENLANAARGAVGDAAQTASGIFLPGRGAGAQAGTDILGPAGQVVGKVQDLADQLHPRIQELFGDHPEYADIAQQGLNDLVDSGANPTQLGRYFAGLERNAGVNQPKIQIGGIGAGDWFRALRNGAMAGGLSTLGHVFLNVPIQSAISLPRETLASVFRGAPEQIPAAVVGLFKGYSAGWEAASQQLRYGLSAAEGATGELPFGTTALRATNPVAESAYNALQGLVTTHGVAQTFMENVGFIQKLTQQAWTMAKDEGLAGQAFTQRVEEIVNNAAIDPKLADVLATAQQYGKRMALRGEQGWLGRGAQKVASAGPAGNLLIPFESIAYNVLSRGLEMTPAGVAGTGLDVARKAIGTGPYAAGASEAAAAAVAPISERLANNVIGLGLLGFGLDMAMHGRVVGNGPDNPTERRAWLDQGGQPDSLVFGGQENAQGQIVGGRYVSGHLLGSAFYPFATAASIVEAHRANPDAPVQNQMLDAVRRTGEYVTNETWLRSVAQLTDALKTEGGAGQKAQAYLANLTESFVPQTALLRNVEQATDPSVRQAPKGDFLGRLATAYPGFAGQEPPKLNLMGNPVSNPNEGVGIFAPTGRGQVEPVEQALGQASMALTSPPTHVQINDTYSTDITPDEQRTWEQARGQRLSQVVGRLIENPGFSALPMDRRRELLQRAIDSADEIASKTVLKTIPHDELVQRAKAYQQQAVRKPFASTAAP